MTADEVPSEAREAVRAAAQITTGYGGRLEDVYRRWRRRRRRQAGAAFGGVAVVLLGVSLLTVNRDAAPVPTPQLPQATSASPAVSPAVSASSAQVTTVAQRLFLTMPLGSYRSDRTAKPVRLGDGGGVGEVTPDGRIVVHKEVGADFWERAVGLPDGRIVAFGSEDLSAGVSRPDGKNVSGLALNLLVVSPAGKVQLSRDVRKPGDRAGLLSADARTAYLWRKTGLFSHDLKTGAERRVLSTKLLGGDPTAGGVAAADVAGGRLAFVRGTDGCRIRLADVDSGDIRDLPGSLARNCGFVQSVRLSPDGAVLAVGVEGIIKIVRLSDGTVVKEGAVVGGYNRAEEVSVDFAWQDDRTLRVVRVPNGSESYYLTPFTISY